VLLCSPVSGHLVAAVRRVALAGPAAWSAIVAGTALLIRLPLMFDPSPVIQGDTKGYMSIADEITHGGLGPYAILRPPGYPLFIDLVRQLPGRGVDNMIVAQHLLGVALAVGILLVGWRLFGKPAGILAGLIAAISPQLVAVEHELLSDYLFLVLVFSGTVVLAFAALGQSRRLLLITGLLFGMATLTKPLGQVLIVVAPLVLAILLRGWRPVVRLSLIVTLGIGLLVIPWVVRNEIATGHPVVSTIGDEILFWRAFDSERQLPFVGHDAVTNTVRRLYATAGRARNGGSEQVWAIRDVLQRRGYSKYDAGVQERRMALRAIGAAPIAFATDGARHFRAYATTPAASMTDWSVGLIKPAYLRATTSAPSFVYRPIGSASWRVLEHVSILSGLWSFLTVFGLTGLLLLRSRDPAQRAGVVTFASAWFVLGIALGLIAVPDVRYSAVGLPLIWILGSAGLVLVARTLWERVRERRRATAAA